ncbi:Uncharacterised protein [Moraxella lacunata]|uniref:Chemotaxis protein n=1 Tax=Moraxella lacunata TaxID=477 RepID=A0A378T6J3_MORLA|nr:hypothetical protein [Moraxella lacunata]STZ56014.1 Uncharacterised protein [Moraxella lacunata]
MPIPIILGGLAAAAAVTGVAKGVKGVMDNNEAKELNELAQSIVEEAEFNLEQAKKHSQASLELLGTAKVTILNMSVKKFLELFRQIKNVDFEHDGNLGNLELTDFDVADFTMLRQEVAFVVSSGLGVAGGATGGALAAFGAYNGVMALGAASTGTAISTLSGAAATNATLAWLGGGSLAAGGYGIAGGTMVLGAVAAGPAMLIAGWYMGAKASKNLDDAKSNIAQAKAFKADIDTTITAVDGIAKLAIQLKDLFHQVRVETKKTLGELERVIASQGTDYSKYSETAKLCVMKNVKIMQLIKAMLDIAILDKGGNVLGDAQSSIFKAKQIIDNNYQGQIDNL